MDWVKVIVDKYWGQLPSWKQTILSIAFHIKTIAFIIALILHGYILYFIFGASIPENFYAFRSDLTIVSNFLNESGNKNSTYLILDKFSIITVEYLTTETGRPYIQIDPEDSWKLTGLKPGDKIVFAQSSLFDIRKFKEYHPEVELVMEKKNQFDQTIMAVYTVK